VNKWLQTKPGHRALDETFVCVHCGQRVSAVAPGARERSHCPHCLWGLHIDAHTAGQTADCGGQMEPTALSTPVTGAWSLVHRCRQCDAMLVHAVAVDDDGAALLSIGTRPVRQRVRQDLV
jgi:hypothetical protein